MTKTLSEKAQEILFPTFVIAALAWGWTQREEYWINAEEGLGYYLGIAGATLMALLLLYPVRKKARWMNKILKIKFWFKGHMIFGVIGPLLILFHSNFSLGSMNSNVALFSMLLVAFSGLIGRYIYRHTHSGLYGKKLNYDQLQKQQQYLKQQLTSSRGLDPLLQKQLDEIESLIITKNSTLTHSLRSLIQVNILSNRLLAQLKTSNATLLQTVGGQQVSIDDLTRHVQEEVETLRSMIVLSVSNRLFSIWHIVHLPFFYMMIVTAIVHIVVVHMY